MATQEIELDISEWLEGFPYRFFDNNLMSTSFRLTVKDGEPNRQEKVYNWLRECEKKIAKGLGLSSTWVHISINGNSLCLQ